MNGHLLAASILAAALAVPAGASAQASQPARPKLGVGVAVVPSGPLTATEIYAPISVAPNLRVEPSVGILTIDTGPVSTRDLTLGAGVFALMRIGPGTDLQYGGRLKLGFASVSTDGPGGDDSGTDVVLAGALGAEHWLGDHFSLGLEGQLGYYSLSTVSGDASGLFTEGVVLARAYF
jgi:hypothetical protein